jgi:hypothetical protein
VSDTLDTATTTRHVANMRRLRHLWMRQDYLDNVERKEGVEARKRLEAAFRADWEERNRER